MSGNDLSIENNPGKSMKPPLILSGIVLVLMVAQAVIGLFVPGMYAKDSTWGKAVFLGNDLVNLVLFVPLLLIALILGIRGTPKGKLFWLGIQALITYNYIYYPLAVVYNPYFMLYAAILGMSLYSFIFGIRAIDFEPYAKFIPGKAVRIAVSVLTWLFALALAFNWISRWLVFVITGATPMEGIGMISTFDLITLVVPLTLSPVWLLRREARGYVLSTVINLTCGWYCFVLMGYTPFALKLHLSDAWTFLPNYYALAVISLTAAVLLLRTRPENH